MSGWSELSWCSLHCVDAAAHGNYGPEEKMFSFHKPKAHQNTEDCCIYRVKYSSSQFMGSKHYDKDFHSCFGLH